MFDIGWTEMLVIAVVMILVVGPKDLPGMLRTIGKTFGNLRRMAGDFQRQFNDALKEADIDEVKQDLAQTTSIENPLSDITKSADELLSSLDADDESTLEKQKFDKIQAEIAEGKATKEPVSIKSTEKSTAKKAPIKKAPAKKTAARKTSKTGIPRKKPAPKPASGKTSAKPQAKRAPSSKSKTMTGSKTA